MPYNSQEGWNNGLGVEMTRYWQFELVVWNKGYRSKQKPKLTKKNKWRTSKNKNWKNIKFIIAILESRNWKPKLIRDKFYWGLKSKLQIPRVQPCPKSNFKNLNWLMPIVTLPIERSHLMFMCTTKLISFTFDWLL